ncbi:MAG: DUF2061 domain-containing protein [Bacteroidales bacterium]|nr:DUF2061 domain-containing protein [Bacteroidales bacterium]MCF8334217.1 DUF2061 domain-containing protein [Bacteroidales bacterium]
MVNNKKSKLNVGIKDSPGRSIAKAISWRFIATATTFLISFIVFHQYTEKTFSENMQNAGLIAFVEFFAKILFYYFHERLWTNIQWGKYWRRTLIGRHLWKRKYRNMHKKEQLQ